MHSELKTVIPKIKSGKIGILPTDTIYGLCCSALDKKAVEKIYKVKGKPAGFPLIILISSFADLMKFNVKISSKDTKMLKEIWPNSISVILPCPGKKFSYLHRGTESISFRLPKEKWLLDFVKQSGPIIATSANIHNQENAETIDQAKAYFGKKVDFYVDQGQIAGSSSTIVFLENGELYLMREGKYQLPKSIKVHRVIKKKTWPNMFEAISKGIKKFDLRVNDFECSPGDMILLQEYDPKTEKYTGRTIRKKVTYILKFKPADYPFAKPEDVGRHGLQILSLD